jgi:DNA-binding CsgD family transcriptional regulator
MGKEMNNSRDIAAAWQALTPMQRAVAVLARDDLPDKQIAQKLHLSEPGVRYHLRMLRRAFSCQSKLSVAVAVERMTGALSKVIP